MSERDVWNKKFSPFDKGKVGKLYTLETTKLRADTYFEILVLVNPNFYREQVHKHMNNLPFHKCHYLRFLLENRIAVYTIGLKISIA